jgi:hypothetical protein
MDGLADSTKVDIGKDVGVSKPLDKAVTVAVGTLIDTEVVGESSVGMPLTGLHPTRKRIPGSANKNNRSIENPFTISIDKPS